MNLAVSNVNFSSYHKIPVSKPVNQEPEAPAPVTSEQRYWYSQGLAKAFTVMALSGAIVGTGAAVSSCSKDDGPDAVDTTKTVASTPTNQDILNIQKALGVPGVTNSKTVTGLKSLKYLESVISEDNIEEDRYQKFVKTASDDKSVTYDIYESSDFDKSQGEDAPICNKPSAQAVVHHENDGLHVTYYDNNYELQGRDTVLVGKEFAREDVFTIKGGQVYRSVDGEAPRLQQKQSNGSIIEKWGIFKTVCSGIEAVND